MTATNQYAITLLLTALSFSASAQVVHRQGGASEQKTVALTADRCASVADGDTVTFDWAPSFDLPGAGLSRFAIRFVRPEEIGRAHQPQEILLESAPARSEYAPVEAPIVSLGNGSYRLSFRAHLQSVTPGTYRLYQAEAVPTFPEEYRGRTPQMTNTPVGYNFCIEVSPVGGHHRD